jgi:mannose-6-phosphate isomerase-like protein (cupin superfamily)
MGTEVTPLWGADAVPSFPLDGTGGGFSSMFPTSGGYRFLIMTIPPDAEAATTALPTLTAEDFARIGGGAGGADVVEPDAPGMHTTDTVDFEVVLSGEASQEFDDGQVVHLQAGDCFVQNGTRHRWFNRGSVPAVVAAVLIGGHPRRC